MLAKQIIYSLSLAGLLLLGISHAEAARDPEDYEKIPVHKRDHPDFSPDDIIVGSFIVRPVLETIGMYDSNVFLDKDNETHDLAFSFRPSVTARTEIDRHALNFEFTADATQHMFETDQDTTDVSGMAQARVEVQENLQAYMTLNTIFGHEDRDNDTTPSAPQEPTKTQRHMAELALNYTPARFNLTLYGRYKIDKFDNGVNRLTGGELIEEDRNKKVLDSGVRVAYDAHPNYEPYMLLKYSDERYDHDIYQPTTGGFTGANQDRQIYTAAPGVLFNYKDIVSGRVEAGIAYEDYEDSGLDDKAIYVVDSEITWNASPLTTVTGVVNRSFDTDSNTNFGTVQTTAEVNAYHELKRNFIIGGKIQTILRDYDNNDREDRIYTFSLDGEYRFNKNFSITGGYILNRRLSENTSLDYNQNIFYVGAKNRF